MRNLETVWCCQHSRSQPRYPRFTLCPECRPEAPHEAIVVEAVVNYFSKPEFREFFIETEREIQIGSDTRRPDVVLMDSKGSFTAIVECKKSGIVSYGRGQLKSYLCATDTQFGVFANSIYPYDWEFCENLRGNRFRDIKREQFETEVGVERSIEQITPEENKFKSDWPTRAGFARRREKAKRANRQDV
ncbi:MAG: type I restriction enzyme HsdR N-terminal domain-containing protein [Candidatus Poribacteria bacterium]|nr:type I restriction enzyme HsdR N-terminal domain-containing protein [Candidatus Poribacteria bacterium]